MLDSIMDEDTTLASMLKAIRENLQIHWMLHHNTDGNGIRSHNIECILPNGKAWILHPMTDLQVAIIHYLSSEYNGRIRYANILNEESSHIFVKLHIKMVECGISYHYPIPADNIIQDLIWNIIHREHTI